MMVNSILSANVMTYVMLVQTLIMHVIPIQLVSTLMAAMIVSVISDWDQITMVYQILSVSMSIQLVLTQLAHTSVTAIMDRNLYKSCTTR